MKLYRLFSSQYLLNPSYLIFSKITIILFVIEMYASCYSYAPYTQKMLPITVSLGVEYQCF